MNVSPSISIDPVSFAFGVAVATVVWWIVARARPLWTELRASLERRRLRAQGRQMSLIEQDYRRETLRRAQGMHLGAPLFALEEIVQEPELLAPPAFVEPGEQQVTEDVVALTVPYLPAWPELAAIYQASTLSFGEALAGGANLVIIGQPGSGKTVALAHLATLAANRSETLGPMREAVPFLLHVADLSLPMHSAKEALTRIAEMAAEHASVLDQGRTAAFAEDCFHSGRALLLLDGFDELTAQGQAEVTDYLSLLLHAFPNLHIVTTGGPEYVDGLLALDFVPLALAAWSARRREHFIGQWIALWSRTVAVDSPPGILPVPVDPVLLESWLALNTQSLTPLELTLRAWAASAGDAMGPHVLDALAAHVRRLAPPETPMVALESLAMQVNLTAQPIFDPRRARAWVKDFELPAEAIRATEDEEAEVPQESGVESTTRRRGRDVTVPATSPGLLGRLASTGLVVGSRHNTARFVHPVIGGYLAGRGLSAYKAGDTLIDQPDWIGKFLTMRYFAAHGDVNALIDVMLQWSRLPMHRPLLNVARWLRDSPQGAPWRLRIVSALADLIRTSGLPLSLRGQALTALICSEDPSIAALFRQLMAGASAGLRQLAVLGSGALHDEKAIGDIAPMLSSTSNDARRAACLALVAIGTTRALEHVGHALLSGDDELRRAAAESLANDPDDGYAMLRDGATMKDTPLRRASAYGLGRVREIWAMELLEKLRSEDDQWVVRSAATAMLESNSHPADPRVPRQLTPPSEAAWLIAFAGTLGLGISPGAPATDVLLAALKSKNREERLAALAYLKRTPSDAVIREIYAAMSGDDVELREAAFLCLWEIGASGQKLPSSSGFAAA